MLNIYKTESGIIHQIRNYETDCWICLTAPTEEEINEIAMEYNIEADDLQAALDVEESSRVALEDDYTLIIVNLPADEIHAKEQSYATIPLAMIVTDHAIITVCKQETDVLNEFISNRIKGFSVKKKMRFVYQILFVTANMYQQALHHIDKVRREIEERYHEDNNKVDDMIALHDLGSTLVYFEASLHGNDTVLNRLKLYKKIDMYEDDEELLDDVIIENNQAIEMANIYKDIISGTADLVSTIVDSKLNIAMKFLTSISLVVAIPTIISGIYGMNVKMPLQNYRYSFDIIMGATVVICVIVMIILHRKNML